MTDMNKVTLAFDLLEDADIVEEFEDTLFIKVDKQMWDRLWESSDENV